MRDSGLKPYVGRYWHELNNKRIQCDLCPRYCRLKEGQRGFCFVRKNEENRMILTTYGRSSGFCVDPIEKKPLNHFYPGTSILSFGTAGCNLGCKFCQNWHMSKSKEMDKLADTASPETIARAAKEMGCKSVAFTYNDPVIFAEYAIDIAEECHKLDIKTVAVTAGYITLEAGKEFFAHMDAANVDLKAFTNEFYRKLCLGELDPVLDILKYLKNETDVWIEITTLLIPGSNDSEKEIQELVNWIMKELGPDVPLHFTAFHPDFKLRSRPPTSGELLSKARQIALSSGIRYVFTGNVQDLTGGSTFCHECGSLLIERNWFHLGQYSLDNSNCRNCGCSIPGKFDDSPGTWGGKRASVRLSNYR
ncbi:MAG: AmmeMemoRadiSam system radical SAM enzyme [bacterium]|nr:AmmeMemoRadiSam system radical SAM enzyme [bacterium]